jgi:hypothetical protein
MPSRQQRQHVPCKVCSSKHANPASSSTCEDCGPQVALDNLKLKEELQQSNDQTPVHKNATHVLGGNCYCAVDPIGMADTSRGDGDGYEYFTFINDDTALEKGHRLIADIKRIEELKKALSNLLGATTKLYSTCSRLGHAEDAAEKVIKG